MIARTLTSHLLAAAGRMPVVAVTGPRQSGKTTLCRATFPDHEYVSLEPLDTRDFAVSDPRGFLAQYGHRVILDEAQRAPDLFSYLQEEVDRDATPGRFILTGSQHFGLSESISQSLAGRVALLHLLPPSLDEVHRFADPPGDLWTTLWTGAYPRILDRGLPPREWLADYTATYVQRDVRQVLQVTDLDTFTAFLRLAAGRTAQEQNLSTLGADAGVTHNTARAWLSVLEASFVVFRVPPWLRNVRKRTVKAPKLHFVDSGLTCHLLGIHEPEQLRTHPLRGAVFESWVASEILKARLHRGLPSDLFHLREARGAELDIVVEAGRQIIAVEVKSGATVAPDAFRHLEGFARLAGEAAPHLEPLSRVIYGGDTPQRRTGAEILPWNSIQEVAWG
ncbi:MAG: ATP-binding protein [Gemmatimonadota bacterium]|nr:ATP-binding protein [Gemmatimonadota bacterium]MDH5761116.1 ATP-binding protein [Gemmatimonadota bacterium]